MDVSFIHCNLAKNDYWHDSGAPYKGMKRKSCCVKCRDQINELNLLVVQKEININQDWYFIAAFVNKKNKNQNYWNVYRRKSY